MTLANPIDSNPIYQANCRCCGKFGLNSMLSLGQLPVNLRPLTEAQLQQSEPKWELKLGRCSECSLVQIIDGVPTDGSHGQSGYFASFSETLVRQAKELATDMTAAMKLNANSHVVEIGSNDGYLLQWYKQAGIPVLGIESAQNIGRMAEVQKGIPTISEKFNRDLGRQLGKKGPKADIVHANYVLSQVADPNDFVAGFKELLKPTGVLIVEVPYVRNLIDRFDFDAINHEHLSYFSLTALDRLFRRQGLMISEVEKLPTHGGSLRLFAKHMSNERPAMSVVRLLAQEDQWVYRDSYYHQFSDRIMALRTDLVALLKRLKCDNKRIAVFGASAKSSTLLNYLGLDADLLEYVVDHNAIKVGHFTPGTHLKIYDASQLHRDQPDYCLLLTGGITNEIMAQQKQYRDQGGKFIIPMPNLKVA